MDQKKKFSLVLQSLEVIAKSSDENEFSTIKELEKKGFLISNEETVPFRPNQKAFVVLMPFSIEIYNNLKQYFIFQAPEYLLKRYIKKFTKNNKKYLTIPYSINLSDDDIDQEICIDLKDIFRINYDYLSNEDWNFIKSTKYWKLCIKQKIREKIAIEIAESKGLSW